MVFKRVIQTLIVALFCALVLAIFATLFSVKLLQQPLALPQSTLFEVKRGMHAKQILNALAEQGADLQLPYAYMVSRIFDQPENLQAGYYQLQPQDSLRELWRKLRDGEQHHFQVTLVEGRTLQDWLQQLHAHAQYLRLELAALPFTDAQQSLAAKLKISKTNLEGLFFPETYSFTAGTADTTILREAYQNMQDELERVWSQRDPNLPYENSYQLLIMASIIEKETGADGERALVSSVFVNRLRKGMRLQSDPTTIYGIDNFDGNLTRAHLREETAYNTYRIAGLPPTPIAMPSRLSLEAAAHPEDTDYFYFVADGQGGHVFSKTLAEHNRAVNKYQRKQG